MDTQRAFVAILLSFVILLGYQYFFVGAPPEQARNPVATEQAESPPVDGPAPAALPQAPATAPAPVAVVQPTRQGRDITVETDLFSALISETGGGVKSFKLKKYMESMAPDSDYKELITTKAFQELPLYFSWGVSPEKAEIPVFTASTGSLILGPAGSGREQSLRMEATLSSGLVIVRTLTFDNTNYLANLEVEVRNTTDTPLQGAPYLGLTNLPFNPDSQRYLFAGPAVLVNDSLEEVKVSDLNKKGPKTLTGRIDWAAYEGNYFMTGMIPGEKDGAKVLLSADNDKVSTVLSAGQDVIPAQGRQHYAYSFYFGPKKLSTLKQTGHNLERIVNFGWFDKMARPVLYLLNFLYRYVHNYGVAIIMVTVLIKLVLWPISHKGMKSMKNMQAIQPKIAKLREKYKNDSARINQEMMNLYKTYKVNPLGGCLPMFLQIPVFFALYKVLLQAIELRHAPFMLWITDLAAPDRLWIGIDIPYLHGIPVLTLLMGASMFLQQKMTPSPADPTQAKIMLFLPVIFTFMFINFASGLVLYWFVNNLLAIAQQYIVNRPAKS
ncbi:MAG: membrane protein insertase YidC [Desulfobacterales bacterium]|nr:membrane protein insertase YidC [Desulfobacterales bacterium]